MPRRVKKSVEGVVAVTEENDVSSIGGSLSDFLKEDGIYDEVYAAAAKKVFVWQMAQAMKKVPVTRVAVAKRMKTSRPQLDRILDPKNVSTSLKTLSNAAASVGKKLKIELVDA